MDRKPNSSIVIAALLILTSGCKTTPTNDTPVALDELDGVWQGVAVDSPSRTQKACNIKMPVAFIVLDGRAISLSKDPRLQFDVGIEPDGEIRFTYKELVKHTFRRSGGFSETQMLDMEFDGQLSPAKGEGRFSVASCSGKWTVEKISNDSTFNDMVEKDRHAQLPKSVKMFSSHTVYEYGKPKFTVHDGDVLEVLSRKVCRSGSGECWKVRDPKTGKIGYVRAADMRRNHGLVY